MNSIHPKLSAKELEQIIFDDYVAELRKARRLKTMPLHLYSKRVYRAYRGAWRIIRRNLLTPEEIAIMKQLGCYKDSRRPSAQGN